MNGMCCLMEENVTFFGNECVLFMEGMAGNIGTNTLNYLNKLEDSIVFTSLNNSDFYQLFTVISLMIEYF